ncbi:glucan endo-1,3-beta-glucosidase [Artemisia annua]|uniref:Glucan endo-1,3-beta-glucosidase n=1 Tax=Artemisia annua TaxID=35608 RepID=A0A2U1MIT4_ARTAN|nr:glucan endo-1,3-beta-glucosidase [Artemisia annua]
MSKDGGAVGVNYGLIADNLPSPAQAINLLKSNNVDRIRIFSPNHDVLNALQNSGIQVIIGTFDDDVPKLASDINFAINWVETNIVPYAQSITFRCISVGNEIIPGDLASSVLAAMGSLNAALQSFNLGNIPVSTTVGFALLASSYPPSSGDFLSDYKAMMQEISGYLSSHGFPLLLTAYPYFGYASDPSNIQVSYALMNSTETFVKDGSLDDYKAMMQEISGYLSSHGFPLLLTAYPYFGYASDPSNIQVSYALMNSTETFVKDGSLEYKNMFDAMVDSVYWALEKVGAGGLDVVVVESGWPSNGNGEYTTPSLAQTYNQNLVRHANSGTPKIPGKSVETYLFALFNENQKTPGVEQNFGLFYPDMSEVITKLLSDEPPVYLKSTLEGCELSKFTVDQKLPSLLRMLLWAQNQLDEKAVYPRITDLFTAALEDRSV